MPKAVRDNVLRQGEVGHRKETTTKEVSDFYLKGLQRIHEAAPREKKLVSAQVGDQIQEHLHRSWIDGSLRIADLDFGEMFDRIFHGASHGAVVEGERLKKNEFLSKRFPRSSKATFSVARPPTKLSASTWWMASRFHNSASTSKAAFVLEHSNSVRVLTTHKSFL